MLFLRKMSTPIYTERFAHIFREFMVIVKVKNLTPKYPTYWQTNIDVWTRLCMDVQIKGQQ